MTTHLDAGERSQSDFDALFGAAVDAMIVIDASGSIINFNPAAERLFGYRADEVEGRNVRCLMPEPYRSAHDVYIDSYLSGGEPRVIGIGREVEAIDAEGRVFPIWLTVGEAETAAGRHFVGIIRDLSDEKAAESERRALEARLAQVGRFSLMGEMAAGIAHEINQPLSAIATYAQAAKRMLDRGALDEETLHKACSAITEQSVRASRVLDNLQGFIRRQDIETETVDLNTVLKDVMPLIRTDARAAGIPIRLEFADGLPPIEANAVQLQQVLLNLTRNAVDAMSERRHSGGDIVVRTGGVDGGVRFDVVDHGPGVPARLAEGIFHPFVTTKRDGLGVGLAISQTIIKAHGGTLLYADNPQGGAVFSATLPMPDVENANEP